MKFNNRYSDSAHCKPFIFKKPSLTDQSFVFDSDINNIVANFPFNNRIGDVSTSYANGRFITADEYQNAVYELARAKSAFEELPSKLRQKFHNDPKEMIEFLSDEKNNDECIRLGLKEKIEAPQPVEVKVVESVAPVPPTESN